VTNDLILYGAGIHLAEAYVEFVKQGRTPVCVCDGDSSKHFTTISVSSPGAEKCGEIEILPLSTALEKYENADFFVVPKSSVKFEIMKTLEEAGVDNNRILNHQPFAYERTCRYLNTTIHLSSGDNVECCCVYMLNVKAPGVPYSLDNETLLSTLKEMRSNLQRDMANGNEKEYCLGCPEIKMDYVPKTSTTKLNISQIMFGAGTVCNIDCIYCYTKSTANAPWEERKSKIERALDFVKYLQQQGEISDSALAHLASGEISANPMASEIVPVFADIKCRFLTNGIIYSEAIEKVLRNGKSYVNISLDAGTKETFGKVKGTDAENFDKALENIRGYSQFANYIELKYIILPEKMTTLMILKVFWISRKK